MKILQCGHAKSGNYWLWKILSATLDKSGVEKLSYIRNQPIHAVAKTWELSFPEQADVDMIGWRSHGDPRIDSYWWHIEPMFRRRIQDLDDYVRQTNHAWSHAMFGPAAPECLKKFDKVVYIIRDPRDVVLSFANFVKTPFYLREYSPPGQLLSFEERVRARSSTGQKSWKQHVGRWLAGGNAFNVHWIFYERLVDDFHSEYKRLLAYLGLDFDDKAISSVYESTRLESMRSSEFSHVNEGGVSRWMRDMPDDCAQMITGHCFELLEFLGYPVRNDPGAASIPKPVAEPLPQVIVASLA